MPEVDKKEVRSLISQARRKAKAPTDESNVLEWSMAELNAYIKKNTKGKSKKTKLKYAAELIKRIEEAKAQNS